MDLKTWFYSPGDKQVSIGFFINPYRRYSEARFKHIFAFDSLNNFYVGQFSVYSEHIEEMFGKEFIAKKIEHGFIDPTNNVVYFDFLEHINVIFLNRRLKVLAQRLYDYGMPPKTVLKNNLIDMGDPTIFNILKGRFLEKPSLVK